MFTVLLNLLLGLTITITALVLNVSFDRISTIEQYRDSLIQQDSSIEELSQMRVRSMIQTYIEPLTIKNHSQIININTLNQAQTNRHLAYLEDQLLETLRHIRLLEIDSNNIEHIQTIQETIMHCSTLLQQQNIILTSYCPPAITDNIDRLTRAAICDTIMEGSYNIFKYGSHNSIATLNVDLANNNAIHILLTNKISYDTQNDMDASNQTGLHIVRTIANAIGGNISTLKSDTLWVLEACFPTQRNINNS